MFPGSPRRASSRGLSLIELLVAIAIGVVLSFGAMNVLLASKMSYLQADELARMQENGRYALRYLAFELTMAGYLATRSPGLSIGSSEAGTPCFDHLMDSAVPLEHINDVTANGLAGTGGRTLPADCRVRGGHRPGTDILLVRRTVSSPVVAAGEHNGAVDADTIYLYSSPLYDAHRLQRGGGGMAARGSLWEYVPQLVFVRNYALSIGDEIPTLCRKRQGRASNRMAPTECLVEGIENLQLEFGIDETGDMRADRFEQAPDPVELRSAVAARIYLLVRSVHSIAGHVDDRFYDLGSTRVAAARDGHYRRVMQTTVLLRNNGFLHR